MVSLQLEPVQSSAHEMSAAPDAGTAFKVTAVPRSKTVLQDVVQFTPDGVVVTVPGPTTVTDQVCVVGGAGNVGVPLALPNGEVPGLPPPPPQPAAEGKSSPKPMIESNVYPYLSPR